MRRRSTFTLGAAALTVLTACSSGSTSEAGGIILPAGLTAYEQITEIVNAHDMVVRVQSVSGLEGVDAESGLVEMIMVRQPDGDLSADATFMGQTQRFLTVDGIGYLDEGDGWVEDPEATDAMPATLMEIIELGSTFTDPAVTETGTGYTVTAADGGPTLTLSVDGARRLVAFTVDGELQERGTVTYPGDLPRLAAPEDARPAGTGQGGDASDESTLAAEEAGEAAKEVLGEVGRIVDDLLAAGTRLADITPDMVAEQLMAFGVYLDIETGFDPWSVGFANDGTSIEVVTSDGEGACYRATIEPGGVGVLILTDDQGARTDLGFACGTTITHTGPLLDQR